MRFARIVPQVLVAWPPHIIPILGHRSRGAIPTRRLIALAAAFTTLLAAAAVAQPPASDPPKKVVIPFDFESKFDNGEYGQTIGDMLWAKLHRQGGFVIPESMQDVRDWCQRTHMIPGPETTLEKMKEVVAREQAGDIGIWGKIERVQGFETDVYDLWINVADFSVDPPRWIYQKKARTQTVSEIPHIYVKEALDRLYGRTEQIAGAPDPELQKRWEKAPNLVKGDFQQGRERAGRLGPPAPRRHLGCGERQGRESRQSDHPLHDERGRGRLDGRALLQQFLPGRGRSHVSLPVPLADDRLGSQGFHQVL